EPHDRAARCRHRHGGRRRRVGGLRLPPGGPAGGLAGGGGGGGGRGAAEPLIDAIKERIPKVKVGDGMDPSSEMGPLVTREHRDRVASYVENAPGEGATVVVDGREGAPEEGFFLNPSLLDDVTPQMQAYVDEI